MVSLRLADLPPALRRQAEAKLGEIPEEGKSNKYNAQKITVDGITFDSKREADYYCELKILKMAKQVKFFELQPVFVFQATFINNGKRHWAIKYKADFKVTYADGRVEIVDTKGYETKEFKLKRKMFEERYPDLTLTNVK